MDGDEIQHEGLIYEAAPIFHVPTRLLAELTSEEREAT